MLHKVKTSPHAAQLLEVVEMQKQLISQLCALAPESTVDKTWLATIWPQVTDDIWLTQFWNNDNGNRAKWCNEIAGVTKAEKKTLEELLTEQLRFKELYDNPPNVRITRYPGEYLPFSSAKALLNSFYDPLFYKTKDDKGGYPTPTGTRITTKEFIGEPPPRVCPYTDNYPQDTKLDHFLPKDTFPMLSMHPDNLIPCATDPNSVGRKGKRIPLDLDEAEQAAKWFHPRLRAAGNARQGDAIYKVQFDDVLTHTPKISLIANAPDDQCRLENVDGMFGTTALWQRMLVGEFERIQGEIVDELREDGETPDHAVIITKLKRRARHTFKEIGVHALAISKNAFYEFIASENDLVESVRELYFRGT